MQVSVLYTVLSVVTPCSVFSVVLFGMACGLAVFMMLILICGSFYAGLLAEGKYVYIYPMIFVKTGYKYIFILIFHPNELICRKS